MATFEIFRQHNLGVEKYTHVQFRSSHNHFKSCRWGKLNFELLQGKVKSHHFSKRQRENTFTFCTHFFEYLNRNDIGLPFLDTGLESLLTTWIRLAPE